MHDDRSPEIAEHLVPHPAHGAHSAHPAAERDLGFVLTGGGARGAYQVGVLRWIARHWPDLNAPILTGVSAGAVNIAKLAAHHGTFRQAVDELTELWKELTPARVFRVDAGTMLKTSIRWGFRLMSGGTTGPSNVRGFLDTTPLRELLEEVLVPVNGRISGIDYNLARGTLKAVALIATSYTTGQTVSFVQGRNVTPWIRPQRRTVLTDLTVDHVMASAALPMFFPAVRVGDMWYGDGGIRLAAPLSPALHLGANRILAISTRYDRTQVESDAPNVVGYPPPAQVLGMLLNSVFLDLIDQDVLRLERLNSLLDKLPPDERNGLRPIRILTIRPSRDLAVMAADYELNLPWAFRFMTRGLGTQETRAPDVLAMLMFNPAYLQAVMAMGEHDAEARAHELEAFIEGETAAALA